ncbi:MFS transporter [Halalkalibacter urbisdiaboli]|uniref:MFS transporter n=1 Tax=Halalkalibacter urbisdiaboli TaxID=1960589 RepID=UPI000B44665E|nr:MFS transporter [Halalkalibacter urbisdiaboli]
MFRLSLFFFLLFSSFAIMGVIMPLYLKAKGLSTEQVGLVIAMGSVIAVVGQPLFGYVSDKLKSTKKVLIGLLLISLLVSIVYYSVNSFALLLTFFIILNFFKSSTGPLTENITIAYSQKHDKNYGLIRLWGDVGVGTASVIVGTLVGILGLNKLGWMYGTIIIAALCIAFFLKDDRPDNVSPISLQSIKRLFSNKGYVWFLFLGLIIFMAHRLNDSLFSIYLSDLGASESKIGLSWMIAAFSSSPVFILVAWLAKKYREMTLVFIGALLFSVRWLLYGLFPDPDILIYLQALNSVFPVFIVPALFLVTKIVPAEITATGQTIFIAVIVGIGGMIGSAGGGWYMEHFGPPATYITCSIITFIGAILCLLTLIKQKHKMS